MRPPEIGNHLFKLISVTEEANKNKDGFNYWFEFEVISDNSSKGRTCRNMVSSKWVSAPESLVHMAAALQDMKLDEVNAGDIDTDKLLNKTCWAECYPEVYEGKPQVKMRNFASANSKPAF